MEMASTALAASAMALQRNQPENEINPVIDGKLKLDTWFLYIITNLFILF